jgi:hypothetical protein
MHFDKHEQALTPARSTRGLRTASAAPPTPTIGTACAVYSYLAAPAAQHMMIRQSTVRTRAARLQLATAEAEAVQAGSRAVRAWSCRCSGAMGFGGSPPSPGVPMVPFILKVPC